MKSKSYTYESDEITVTYDLNRCIHAKECVKGLPQVFNPDKRPWIQPEQAGEAQIATIVERCPTGALHYEMKESDKREQPAPKNSITIVEDGPVYLRGDIELQDHQGSKLMKDTRMALCRCGDSSLKPLCDGSHSKSEFRAHASIDTASLENESDNDNPSADREPLVLKAMKDGPLLVEGSYMVYSNTTQPVATSKNIALCRCGSSSNKPYCDGTHKEIGFSTE